MPEPADEQPSSGKEDSLAAGFLLLLVLVADVAAVLLAAIVLTVRGLGRADTTAGRTATSVPPLDRGPVLGSWP